MKTSPTTSREERVRAALLDVLHAQWRELGVPFQAPAFEHPLEVIEFTSEAGAASREPSR